MIFWPIAIALCLLVMAPVAAALLVNRSTGSETSDLDLYREQLAEIERDIARELLSGAEAERTRLEVQRRLLEADRRNDSGTVGTASRSTRFGLAALAVLVISGSAGIYATVGAPGRPDLPLSDRIAQSAALSANRPGQDDAERVAERFLPEPDTADPDLAALMDRLRRILESRPDDREGLRLLARNEAGIGNFRAARVAQEKLVALAEDDPPPDDLERLAEYMVLAAGGVVTADAARLIDEVLIVDPRSGLATYYKGLAQAQVGRYDEAFALWNGLLDRSPASAPWIAPIRTQIGDVAALAGVRYDPPPIPGPGPEDIANAETMPPEDREAMIGNMVSGLAERLATEGGPASDWARLIVAYGVLGQTDRAQAILDEARSVFRPNPADLAVIEEAAGRAGLDG